jgi:hypothetical protein
MDHITRHQKLMYMLSLLVFNRVYRLEIQSVRFDQIPNLKNWKTTPKKKPTRGGGLRQRHT